MDATTKRYREAEILSAAPFPIITCGQISLQIRTDEGKTKYLGITTDEFRAIERILLGEVSCD